MHCRLQGGTVCDEYDQWPLFSIDSAGTGFSGNGGSLSFERHCECAVSGIVVFKCYGNCFFLYATVCFCVMFTGQLFALPVYFLAVNYVAFAFSSGARYVIGYLGYGLGMDTVPEFFDFADSLPDELSVQQCAVCIPAIL